MKPLLAAFVTVLLVTLSVALAVPLSAQTRSPAVDSFLQGGILTLEQEFGRARYTRCRLTVVYNQPPLPRTDRVELICTPLPYPRVDDVATKRDLSTEETKTAEMFHPRRPRPLS